MAVAPTHIKNRRLARSTVRTAPPKDVKRRDFKQRATAENDDEFVRKKSRDNWIRTELALAPWQYSSRTGHFELGVFLRALVDQTNVASLSGNRYWLYGYVENHSLFLKVRTIEQKLIEAKSARFKAECRFLHINMFIGAAAGNESQFI